MTLSEARDRQIVCNIEATFFEAAHHAARKAETSVSTYIRDLVIKDLLAKGMLSERVLAQVITG